jgi:hypothetical protein
VGEPISTTPKKEQEVYFSFTTFSLIVPGTNTVEVSRYSIPSAVRSTEQLL